SGWSSSGSSWSCHTSPNRGTTSVTRRSPTRHKLLSRAILARPIQPCTVLPPEQRSLMNDAACRTRTTGDDGVDSCLVVQSVHCKLIRSHGLACLLRGAGDGPEAK